MKFKIVTPKIYNKSHAKPLQIALKELGRNAVVSNAEGALGADDVVVVVLDGFHFLADAACVASLRAASGVSLFPVFLVSKKDLKALPRNHGLSTEFQELLAKVLTSTGYDATSGLICAEAARKLDDRFPKKVGRHNTLTTQGSGSSSSSSSMSTLASSSSSLPVSIAPPSTKAFARPKLNSNGKRKRESGLSVAKVNVLRNSGFLPSDLKEKPSIDALKEMCRHQDIKGFSSHKKREDLEKFIWKWALQEFVDVDALSSNELFDLAQNLGIDDVMKSHPKTKKLQTIFSFGVPQ